MAYCAQADILHWLGDEPAGSAEANLAILLGDPTGTTIDTDKLGLMIEMADQEIDQYFATRYKLPLNTYTPTDNKQIRSYSIILTLFRINESYYRGQEIPSSMVWMAINARSELKKYATGELQLAIPYNDPDDVTLSSKDLRTTEITTKISEDNLDDFYNGEI